MVHMETLSHCAPVDHELSAWVVVQERVLSTLCWKTPIQTGQRYRLRLGFLIAAQMPVFPSRGVGQPPMSVEQLREREAPCQQRPRGGSVLVEAESELCGAVRLQEIVRPLVHYLVLVLNSEDFDVGNIAEQARDTPRVVGHGHQFDQFVLARQAAHKASCHDVIPQPEVVVDDEGRKVLFRRRPEERLAFAQYPSGGGSQH
mmetsp:Transcript_14495/g.32414  ORF Transcript_14495/g.32414 Transcript_14495/m.32414 type:complete len:202 (-) Transcript_14495:121-726(-)